ncbi:MAG TPA: metallophosphoesterase [Verrucomicrobiae bacterium]|jgi:predicted MPP superfamily phosphohydrolase|nr:metallophosphoesterase [Verrucomicrobiae bacterium]
MKLNILHLADLHASEDDSIYLDSLAEGLSKDIGTFLDKELKPDLVCITGDLINKGELSKQEFALVERKFIQPIQSKLNLSDDAFFYCAGNHDVDRAQVSKSFEAGFVQEVFDQKSFRKFYSSFRADGPDHLMMSKKLHGYIAFLASHKNANLKHSSLFCNTYEFVANGLNIGIASLNSAWRSSQFGGDAGRLIVGEQVVMEAAERIRHCDLRLCLCHHPLEMLAAWDLKPVRQALAKHFHILLNGHVHDSDALSAKQLLGTLFVSTAGCLRPGDPFASYTLIHVNLDLEEITCHFRKWYPERETFDQELSKAAKGQATFSGIRNVSAAASAALQISVVRGRMQAQSQENDLVCPLDGLEEVELGEVFVDPVLTNKSGFDRDSEDQKTFSLDDLLKSKENLFIAGRPEFGKTTLLRYAKTFILSNDSLYETNVPVEFKFSDIPKGHPKNLIRLVSRIAGQTIEQTEAFASLGQLTLLVDDFNDRQDGDHDKRVSNLKSFYLTYPKCRYILMATEHIAQSLQFELLTLSSFFNAKIRYISSLNTARIRQLLQKWKAKQDFDLDTMLHQILYYYQHFQIPVTPLSVVLFLGVLFRKKKEKNIRNEAFLIENYLETILEKLNPSNREADLDFRDKEDFLADIAWQMVQRKKQKLEVNEFEQIKLAHFERQDEDVPHHGFFEAFFKKGVLIRDDGYICFRRRFWFNFFLAKALDREKEIEEELLGRDDVLKYTKALTYKAGLSRNDIELLKWVDERAMKEMQPLAEKFGGFELRDAGEDAPLHVISKAIAEEIREKNNDEEVDKRRDEMYLSYDEDKGSYEEQQMEQYDSLLTLQSDIIRNTTKIGVNDKRKFIENNVSSYLALMWCGLEVFREVLQKTDEEELFKLFFKGKKDATMEHKLRFVINHAQRIVHQIVPLSIVIYMNEHLGNPKLVKSFRILAQGTPSGTKKLFYNLLIFAQKPNEGIRELKTMITSASSITEDYIICGFLRSYCNENKVGDDILNKIVAILDSVRTKYAKRVKNAANEMPFLKDSFRPDTKKELQSKHII